MTKMDEEKIRVRELYEADVMFEADVCIDGSSFLIIYGRHVNGYYCCIPNWNYGCEMADPEDTFYNYERLSKCDISRETAKKLAIAIKEIAGHLEEEAKK